jgi:diguanylate cyclase (GGDEF)-like protein
LVSRPSDLVGRPGGEEFAAALATDAFGGQAFVKRLRKLLAMQQFIAADGTTFNVTISAGIVQLALRETTPEKLVKRADELLYEAKRSGRNRYAIQECDGIHMYEH